MRDFEKNLRKNKEIDEIKGMFAQIIKD